MPCRDPKIDKESLGTMSHATRPSFLQDLYERNIKGRLTDRAHCVCRTPNSNGKVGLQSSDLRGNSALWTHEETVTTYSEGFEQRDGVYKCACRKYRFNRGP
ncbi:hypothetical protein L208DRAFT_1402742 [Tricholoma matsutake]|nr:hypothetical protein L208DRAFT_1402742 [Tricholoma matsutake 945]